MLESLNIEFSSFSCSSVEVSSFNAGIGYSEVLLGIVRRGCWSEMVLVCAMAVPSGGKTCLCAVGGVWWKALLVLRAFKLEVEAYAEVALFALGVGRL